MKAVSARKTGSDIRNAFESKTMRTGDMRCGSLHNHKPDGCIHFNSLFRFHRFHFHSLESASHSRCSQMNICILLIYIRIDSSTCFLCLFFILFSSLSASCISNATNRLVENMKQENYVLVLPHIGKLCELCENREQFRWIKNTMLKLQETIHAENAVCHQVIH